MTNKMKLTAGVVVLGAAALVGASACTNAASLKPSGNTSTSTSQPSQSAPQPPPAPKTPSDAAVLLNYTGQGTAVTPKFTSHSGNYVISWSYSGNRDQFGETNFIISEDGGNDYNALSLPNDIAASGHGSTSVTNDPGTHNFNVDAGSGASWTIKVESE